MKTDSIFQLLGKNQCGTELHDTKNPTTQVQIEVNPYQYLQIPSTQTRIENPSVWKVLSLF